MIDRYGPGPPPLEELDGLLGCLVLGIAILIFMVVFPALLGVGGFLFLVSVFCMPAPTAVAVAALLTCLIIISICVSIWAAATGLMPVILFVGTCSALIGALGAIVGGVTGSVAVTLVLALVAFIPAWQLVKTNKINLTGKGWLFDLLLVYWFLCFGTYFLGVVCLFVVSILFGIDIDSLLFGWELGLTPTPPFVELECCHGADGQP